MIDLHSLPFALIIATIMFYTPLFLKLSFIHKPVLTFAYPLGMSGLLAASLGSPFILVLQLLIVIAQYLKARFSLVGSKLYLLANNAEMLALLLTVLFVFLLPIPEKTLVIMALTGNRFLLYIQKHFASKKRSLFSEKYIVFWMLLIFIICIKLRYTF